MASKQQLESQILHIVDRAAKRQIGDEDSFVELKSEFPENHQKTARQIGALCNAAQGNEVIWIVGVDNKTGKTVGTKTTELESWWPQVEKWFDELIPDMQSINVPIGDDGTVVVGLFFASDRTPYVVKTGLNGGVEREVPWRSGTRTRSAKRGEILRLLNPDKRLPEMEFLGARGSIDCSASQTLLKYQAGTGARQEVEQPPYLHFYISVQVFIEAVSEVTFPTHRSRATLTIPEVFNELPLSIDFAASENNATWIEANTHAALVKKPTALTFDCRKSLEITGETSRYRDLEFESIVANLRTSETLILDITLDATEGRGKWNSAVSLSRMKDKEEQFGHKIYFRWKTN